MPSKSELRHCPRLREVAVLRRAGATCGCGDGAKHNDTLARWTVGLSYGTNTVMCAAVSAHVPPLNHTHTACILPKPSPEQSHMLMSISWLVLNLISTQGHACLLTVERHHRITSGRLEDSP